MAHAVGNKQVGSSSPSNGQSEEPSSFEELGIRAEIISGLQSMNIMRPFNDQIKFLDHLLNKPSEDLIGIAHPGAGKTTAYCISILQRLNLRTEVAQNTLQALVLVPRPWLAPIVANQLRTIGRFLHGLTVLTVIDGHYRSTGEQVGCSVIVGSPPLGESAVSSRERSRGDEMGMFIIDNIVEDEVSDCEAAKGLLPINTQVALFSATPIAPKYTSTLAPNAKTIQIQPERSLLSTKHLSIMIEKDVSKLEKLLDLFSVLSLGSVIVFVMHRNCRSEILGRLLKEGFQAAILEWHYDGTVLDDWRTGKIKIMIVSTYNGYDLAASNASHVFIYDIPPANDPSTAFLRYLHCIGRAGYQRSSITFSFFENDEEWDRGVLKGMEEYLQAKMPSLEWEDLDQLESALESIIRPQRRRPGLLDNDEASSNETCSLMESATSPQRERARRLNSDEASRNEASSLMDSIHSSMSAPQTAGYTATRRDMSDPAARQARRPKSQSSRPGKRRGDPMTEASVVPSLAKRSTNFTFGTNIVEEVGSGKEASYKTFQYLNATVDQRLQHKERDERVRIAVLDTGIDLSHEDFAKTRTKDFIGRTGANPVRGELSQLKRVKAYGDFCIQDGNAEEEETNVNDLNGHGTQVAGIILRLAPNAEVYIARVCAGKNRADPVAGHQDPFQEPQPSIVAKAVEWAIAQNVHIINLSLGYRHSDPATMESLRASLDRARAHKILVFAAASNEGLHEPVAWPASDLQYAIGIHSATDAGKESDTTAPPLRGSYNFMVVGERILSHWPTANGGGFRLCTGSSFAAPVATAIAALILAFTWQTRCKKEREKAAKKVRLDDLRTNWGMAKVLSRISKTKGDFHSISPQLFWEDYHDLEDPTQNEVESRQHAWQIIEAALRV